MNRATLETCNAQSNEITKNMQFTHTRLLMTKLWTPKRARKKEFVEGAMDRTVCRVHTHILTVQETVNWGVWTVPEGHAVFQVLRGLE